MNNNYYDNNYNNYNNNYNNYNDGNYNNNFGNYNGYNNYNNYNNMVGKPKKKINIGLIIVILLIIGGVAAFFLYVKPKYLDNQEDEVSRPYVELYASYLEENFDNKVNISLIDLNNDKTPELIVKDGVNILEIDTIFGNSKVKKIEVNLNGKLDLFYDKDNEKDVWFIVVDDDLDYKFYDLVETLKDYKLPDADSLVKLKTNNAFATYMAVEKAKRKYISYEANVNYVAVEAKDATKTLKELASKNNYSSNVNLNDIMSELENLYREHKLVCIGKNEDELNITAELLFNNNQLTHYKYYGIIEIEKTPTAEEEKVWMNNYMSKYEGIFGHKVLTITKKANNTYLLNFNHTPEDFLAITHTDDRLEDLTFENLEQILQEFDGFTCGLDEKAIK